MITASMKVYILQLAPNKLRIKCERVIWVNVLAKAEFG